jgi:hypothetical protein
MTVRKRWSKKKNLRKRGARKEHYKKGRKKSTLEKGEQEIKVRTEEQ